MSTEAYRDESPGSGGRGEFPPRNQLERLRVSSGLLLILDQYMLANEQFLSRLPADTGSEEEWEAGVKHAVGMYGGSVLRLTPGAWGVFRDAHQSFMLVTPLHDGIPANLTNWRDLFDTEVLDGARQSAELLHRVFIDTRCVVFADANILGDRGLLDEYRDRRRAGNDKGARDLLREHGAAVRYGFNREGDELGVFRLSQVASIGLWPDVVEPPLESDVATF